MHVKSKFIERYMHLQQISLPYMSIILILILIQAKFSSFSCSQVGKINGVMQCSSGIDNQLQTASTASFLGKPGHKLVLKFSSVNVMTQSFLFRQVFSTTVLEVGSWQSPLRKDPHDPEGVPKLANFTADI
ncbi:hypothetical protein V8G54_008525 [Vigna mungo]|uniref:Uncharacterized protein n=1 Tax=Vigna mungo TaxID=3915 RepID=A0AAQ3P7B2_VIGMU